MLIRKFKLSDANEISSLVRKSIFYRDNRGYSLENIYSIINHYSSEKLCSDLDKKIIYVVLDNGKIIGTATLNKDEIMTVFILPQQQGKGIGKKLMELLENEAVKKGLSKVWLVANLYAVRFYEHLGYHIVSDEFHPEWGRAKLMEKNLIS